MSGHHPHKNNPPTSTQMNEVLGKPVAQSPTVDEFDELLTEEKPQINLVELNATLQTQVKELEKNLSEATSKTEELRNQYLLAMADRENEKKRWQRELEQTRQFAVQKLTQDLLPVLDTMERAIETMHTSLSQATADATLLQAMIDGLTLTLKLFGDTLYKYGVVILNPVGEPFNPNQHEAISTLHNPELEDNHIVQVMQKGYLLSDRVVRPARVVVNKK
jgi:molecular chaperone GrpE